MSNLFSILEVIVPTLVVIFIAICVVVIKELWSLFHEEK